MKASDFHIDDEELDYVFDRPEGHPDKSLTVREFVFGPYPSGLDKPTLILVGGQPGAGKSRAIAEAARGRAGELVPLSGDDLRRFHKDFHWLARERPWLMPNATAQASGGWLLRCIQHAREKRYSLLLEGVFRDPDTVTRTIEQFADAGYRVEVVGLAVPYQVSLLSTLGRFLRPSGDEVARWTPATAHDSAYRMIPSTLRAAEDTEGTWRIRVTNRQAEDLYTSTRKPAGEQNTPPSGSAAIAAELERNTPQSPEAARAWLEVYIKDSSELARRGQTNPKTQETLERLADQARAAGNIAFPDSPEVRRAIHNHAERLRAVPRDTGANLPNVSLPAVTFKTTTDHLRQRAEQTPLEARDARAWLDSYSMCARTHRAR